MDDQDLDRLTGLFRLLSDKTRVHILMLLAEGERNVSTLCEQLSLPQPTVSHHLGLLRQHEIIVNRRSGKQVFYQLNPRMNLGRADTVTIEADRFRVDISQINGNG
jgi:DNA-binding transcriptional ArsR family regulator